jgi:hypothetical protein
MPPPGAAIYLRNLTLHAVMVPLAGGGSRLVMPSDTTAIDRPTRAQACVVAALACEALVVVALPGAGRLGGAQGLALRAFVSAPMRHMIAFRVGMEAMVASRMAQERALAAGEAAEAAERRKIVGDIMARETAAARKLAADRAEAPAIAARNALDWMHNARFAYRVLCNVALQAEVPDRTVYALLDGDLPLPEAIVAVANGELKGLIGRRSEAERRDPRGPNGVVRRYQRRCATTVRLIKLAQRASGARDIDGAARWLADQMAG